jgi:hypothetical protein
MLNKIGRRNILFLLIFFLLALFITFPLIFNLSSVATGYGDELLIAWNHNWNIYNYTSNISNILNIFNANIYFPYNNSLAYSDTYFTTSLITMIPVILLDSPIVANNIMFILSLTLIGFFTYSISYLLTKNNLASFLSGVLIMFSPAYLSELAHIQIMSIFFVSLALLLFIKYLQTKKQFFYIFFLIIFIAQVYNSFLPGFFILFSTIFISIFYLLENKKRINVLFTRKNILLFLISIVLIVPVIIPYFQVSKEFNYSRDIRETIHFAIQPEDFLTTNSLSRLEPLLSQLSFTKDIQGNGEVKHAFIGLTFSILILISFIYVLKKWKKQDFVVKGILTSSIFGFLMSMGPFMHFQRLTIHDPFPIPLPYLFFYYVIPGFKGIRNSGRWEMLFIILAAPVIAVFLTKALKNVDLKVKSILILLLAAVVMFEFNFPIKYYPVPLKKDFPKVYSYISTTPKSNVIIEMPVYNYNVFPYSNQELWREYYSTAHFRRTVNGASGFSPFPWQDTVNDLLAYFPSEDSINKLRKMGVITIIVHKSEYDNLYKNNYKIQNVNTPNGDKVINYLKNSKDFKSEKQFDQDYVFTLKQ